MYTGSELFRIQMLFAGIEANKEHENAAPTYRDTPALEEMAGIILGNSEDSLEVWSNKLPVLMYLARSYDYMCRSGVSVKYHQQVLEAYARLMSFRPLTEEEMPVFESAFGKAVKARNFYQDDACEDLVAIVNGLISEDKIKELLAANSGRHIKNDPIELTDEYLAVIDEVEQKIEETKEVELCHEYWQLKALYLKEHGIKWSSPSVLNPGVMFD